MSQANGLTFVDEAATRGMTDTEQGRGVVCADFDNDGDVDIFMTNRGLENSGAFWMNDDRANTNRSLSVRLAGSPPNTEAVGARIRVTVGGTTQMREIAIGNNFTSQNPTAQIFGLGDRVGGRYRSRSSGRTAAWTPTRTSRPAPLSSTSSRPVVPGR